MSGLWSDFIEAANHSVDDQRAYALVLGVGCVGLAAFSICTGVDIISQPHAVTAASDVACASGSAVASIGTGILASIFSRKAVRTAARMVALERESDLAPTHEFT